MSLLDTASLVVTPNGTKAGKLYSVVPSSGAGDLSVTRATTATRVNSSGLIKSVASNVPRLDYTNGECPSILVEPQRTNLLTYSEQFDNALWTKENATISANAITAPNGALTADLITSTSASFSDILQPTSQASGNAYTLSCYAKKGSSDWIFLRLTFAAAAPRVWFNLNTGAIGTIQSGLTASIESVGNGWFRCSVSGTASATPPADRIDIALANADASTSPNVGNSAYIWGAQLEAGSYATSYIPTTTASVTRNADVISKTGISSLIGQTEGVIYFEISNIANDGGVKAISLSNGSTSNTVEFAYYGNNEYNFIVRSGTQQYIYASTLADVTQMTKFAFAYKQNDFALYINGTQVNTSSSGNIPSSMDRLQFDWANGGYGFYGNANTFALWKTRLTNTQLAQLTTI
jgi:hypothetical protein